jgi:phage shock protein PspC (stress-responsive transcriptional regulator)
MPAGTGREQGGPMTETPSNAGGPERPDAGPSAGPSAGPAAGRSTAWPPPPSVPLVRPARDRVFRGVCAAVGRSTGTDPVLWRVLVVVLAFFGGAGLVLYLAGWLLIPEEGQPESEAQRLARGGGVSTGAAVALVLLALFALGAVFDDGRGLLPLVVVGVLAYLVLRTRSPQAGVAMPPPGTPPRAPAAGAAAWDAPPAWAEPRPGAGVPPPPWGPPPGAPYSAPPPAPPRPRSNLGVLTVSAATVIAGALLLAASLGADGITAPRVLAAALLVVGLGLLVGARWGRSRGLIALAVVLSLAVAATSSADRQFGAETGERVWVVDGSAEHRLAAGSATLDLRELASTERRDLRVEGRVGAGELLVLVPEDLRVRLVSRVGLGELSTPSGVDVVRTESGVGLRRETTLGPPGPRVMTLDVRVGVGDLEVRLVPAS